MMSGILSPAFLQAAGRAGKTPKPEFSGIKLFTVMTDPEIISITGTDIVVKTIKSGVAHEDTYASLSGDTLSISADKNTEIVIVGSIISLELGTNSYFSSILAQNTSVTNFDCSDSYALQELNLSGNTALTNLECYRCYSLKKLDFSENTTLDSVDCGNDFALRELNLSKNTALTNIDMTGCDAIQVIYCLATNENVSDAIANAITNATAADGTVYTDSAGAYYSTIADAATAKGWTIEQLQA